uniref:Amine oxidase n=1 Tax=Panagrolaimus sp. PS1159 TaxID=55785 RepID=A0AC35GEP3_9BILA
MPYAKKQLFDGAPQGSLLKFIATYETPFWRAKGFSGEILSSGATNFKGEVLPLVCVYDATTQNGNPALVGFIHNTFWSDQTFEFRKNGVLQDLARFLGNEALSPIDYIDKDWHLEPYTGGCPASVVPAGNMNAFLHIREPVSLIHFAGTETATEWMGYISGAVQAGKRAANEVLLKLGSRNVDRKQLKDSIYASDYEPPREWDRSYPPTSKKDSIYASDYEPPREWDRSYSRVSRVSYSNLFFAAAILVSGLFIVKRYKFFQNRF